MCSLTWALLRLTVSVCIPLLLSPLLQGPPGRAGFPVNLCRDSLSSHVRLCVSWPSAPLTETTVTVTIMTSGPSRSLYVCSILNTWTDMRTFRFALGLQNLMSCQVLWSKKRSQDFIFKSGSIQPMQIILILEMVGNAYSMIQSFIATKLDIQSLDQS